MLKLIFAIIAITASTIAHAEGSRQLVPSSEVSGISFDGYIVVGGSGYSDVYDQAGKPVLSFTLHDGRANAETDESLVAGKTWCPMDWAETDEDGVNYRLCSLIGEDGHFSQESRYLLKAAYKGFLLFVRSYGYQAMPQPGWATHVSVTNPDGSRVITEAKARSFAKAVLKHISGEKALPRDLDRLGYILDERSMAAEKAELAKKRQQVESGNRLDADYVLRAVDLRDGTMIMDQLGIKPGFGHPAYPNANEGMHLRASLPSLLEKDFAKLGKAGTVVVRQEFKKKELVSYTVRIGKHRVHVFIGYTYNRDQATRLMCQFRSYSDASGRHYFTQGVYFGNGSGDSGRPFTPEELADGTESAGDAVGEFAIRMRHVISDEGLPVKGSEKRSIYFTRGNTAVGVFTDNPAFNVLPAARAIDKLLVEGMRKAGEPLTKEQDYLKEGKKQK